MFERTILSENIEDNKAAADIQDKMPMTIINIGCILALIIVIFPLLLVAKYDYPSADDWSYGVNTYEALKAGGNFFQVLYAAVRGAIQAYWGWDGRFANAFLDSLQPGIWGEKCYALTPWILIGILIVSEMIFFWFLICFGTKSKNNAQVWIPIVIPVLIIQILFTPSPVESFYWYTGGMNYTFMYGLSLILMVLFIILGVQTPRMKWKKILMGGLACILSIFVGGGNFSTSLSTVLVLCIITIIYVMQKRFFFVQRTWFITLTTIVCLVICLMSPGSVKGNSARMTEPGNPLYAIWQSLTISANSIYLWTRTGEVLFMLLFVFPFIWKAVANLPFSFRYPLLFSLLTFGVYSSQVTPNIYVSGSLGGGRHMGILYYSYMVWLVGNIIYWVGWLRKNREAASRQISVNRLHRGMFLLVYCGIVGILIVSHICVFKKKEISSYKAYRDWKQGWAQQYALEWEMRLELLRDDSIKEIVFDPISVYPETLMYTDLQDKSGYTWVNGACAQYYDKKSIQVYTSIE